MQGINGHSLRCRLIFLRPLTLRLWQSSHVLANHTIILASHKWQAVVLFPSIHTSLNLLKNPNNSLLMLQHPPRLLKRQATSDVDDPPARCPPAPSPATSQPTLHVDNSPDFSFLPASQSNPVTSRLAITTPIDAPPPSSSPASQSIHDLLIDPTLGDDSLPPLYSPPTSPCIRANRGLPIAATSDIDQSSAPSSPLTSPVKSATAISIKTDSSPPASPSQSQPAALLPAISITSSVDDSPPPSPIHRPDASQLFEGEHLCSRSQQDCLMTQSPRLDLIGLCKLFKQNIVILVSTGVTSPTRWTDVEPLETYVLYGNDFVQEFRRSLPQVYSPIVRLKVIDDIPVAVRSRLTRARPAPIFPRRPVAGLALPLSTLAHMAAMHLQERSGINLVTSFSWREPRAVHYIDIIPRILLTEHAHKAHKLAYPSEHPESDPVSEFTEDDSFPDTIDHDYPDL
ncbi:hypothetical protein BD410DRAFT_840592 [Rickenella mellea]|uniref:Uncharacterized protein n=1 Tax=Rickenella mellea TaxID=50990 RepID=A0A4Y7Q3E0_9AGAM|nr:hypothetical protein BD410DRAFT_840592 [Rickenella mellea]